MVRTKTSMSLTQDDGASIVAVDYTYQTGANIELVVNTSIIEVYEDGDKVGEVFFSDLPSLVERA